MRRLNVFHCGDLVGTLAAPETLRPPMSEAELTGFPTAKIWWSRSPIYEVRPGDLQLAVTGLGRGEELIIVASHRLGPGDIGCLVGFEPTDATGIYAPDEEDAAAWARFFAGASDGHDA